MTLDDIATEARKALKMKEDEGLIGVMDNLPLHWTDECMAVMEKRKMKFAEFPPHSPGLTYVENSFGRSFKIMDKQHVKKPSDSVKETIQRFRNAMKKQERNGELRNMATGMPQRMKDCIANHGGSIGK